MYKIIYFLAWVFLNLLYKVVITGRENIPKGAALVCANHTSAVDPLLVALAMTNKNPLHFMAKKELLNAPILGAILKSVGAFAVNRGNSDIKAIKRSLRILSADKKLMMFPEGTRVHDESMGKAKTGAAMLATRAGAPVLPVFITAAVRRRFGSNVNVIIGHPFYLDKKDELLQADGYQLGADKIMESIRALKPDTETRADGGQTAL